METLITNTLSGADFLFESRYLALRAKEQRIYTDAQLKQLPIIEKAHPYYHEWQIRAKSANKLIGYLRKKPNALQILEVGCGNGWLAAKIAEIKASMVIGIDANHQEIKQGKRIFHKQNLELVFANLADANFGDLKFDVILFAAAAQYFPSIKELINQVSQWLKVDGEVHILDSNFYDFITAGQAAERTTHYFEKMGFPEMSKYYFHHQLSALDGLHYQILYHPKYFLNRVFVKNPFYWICIKPTHGAVDN